jgi:hypothetical protein
VAQLGAGIIVPAISGIDASLVRAQTVRRIAKFLEHLGVLKCPGAANRPKEGCLTELFWPCQISATAKIA